MTGPIDWPMFWYLCKDADLLRLGDATRDATARVVQTALCWEADPSDVAASHAVLSAAAVLRQRHAELDERAAAAWAAMEVP